MEFFMDLRKTEKELYDKQKERFEKEPKNLKKIEELNKEYDALESVAEQLSDEQKDMLMNVPKTKEEWEEFNELGDDIEKKEEKLLEIFDQISLVIDELPLSGEDFKKEWERLAMEIMKKHHLNN